MAFKQYSFVNELNVTRRRKPDGDYSRATPKERHIVHIYYDEKGKKHFKLVEDYGPMIAIKPKNSPEKFKFKDMHGNILKQKRCTSLEDYYKKDESLDPRWNEWEYDEKTGNPIKKIWSSLYGTDLKPQYQFIGENYPGKIDYDLSLLRIWIIDIEVNSEGGYAEVKDGDKPITSMSIKDLKSGKFYVWATKPWNKKKSVHKDTTVDLSKVNFKLKKDDEEIIDSFNRLLKAKEPDIMVGFYSKNFDFPYIINRAERIDTINKGNHKITAHQDRMTAHTMFNNHGYVHVRGPTIKKGKVEYYPFIGGVQLLDYQMMYKKFVFEPREMYSLDYIASVELGETKLDYSDHDNLAALWREDPQLYIDYNIYDVELVHLLDQKLGLLDLTCTIAYFAKCNFNDVMGTVQPWDTIMFNELRKRNIMIPANIRKSKEKYPGAFVLPNPIGVQNWLFSVDLASLYPHVQQQYNISPETIVEKMVDVNQDAIDERFFTKEIDFDHDYILGASGNYFRKDQEGIIPQVLKGIYADRKIAKQKMLKMKDELEVWKKENGIAVKQEFVDFPEGDLKDQWAEKNKPISALNNYQMAMKILMNSEYGALANRWFRYYDVRLARAVTLGGQLALKWAKEKIENHPYAKKYKYRVVYGDTDSLYISCEYLVEQLRLRNPEITDQQLADQIVKFVQKKVQPIIDDGYEDLAEYMNANENRMFMESEKIITNALFSTKKRYAMNVLWDEGVTYPEPKLKVKGFEIVRSSTPKVIRDALKKAVSILLIDEEKLRDFVINEKRKFRKNIPEKIAFPRSANNIDAYRKEDKSGNLIWDYKRRIFNPEKKSYSGTPIGVKAAILYNKYIKKNKLEFPMIQSGEKIKFIYLTKPNTIDDKVIGFIRRMPEDLKIYIDWDLMFDKSFLSPIHKIYENMGKQFTLVKETNILDLF